MQETSLKQMLQRMSGEKTSIVQGIVTSENPISVSLVNDTLMNIPSSLIVVPEHLTVRRLNVKVTMSNISGNTNNGGAGNTGENSGTTKSDGGGITGEGGNSLTDTISLTMGGDTTTHNHAVSAHKHSFDFGITSQNAVIEYDNSLKLGDRVHLLSIGDGKIYYVIDRVV